MILRNPQALWLLLLVPLLVALWRWRGRRVVPGALALRLGMVSLLVLAVADPLLGQSPPPPGPLVIVVDQSDSLADAGKEALRQRASQLAAAAGAHARVLFFGADVLAPTEPGAAAAPDGSASDIAGALRAARGLLGGGGGRIVLLSDGAQTTGDALSEARLAAAQGVVVDVEPTTVVPAPELRLAALDAPRTLRVGEEYSAQVRVNATQAGAARLTLWANEALVGQQDVELTAGENPFSFPLTAASPGVVRLRATISGGPDTFDRNNAAAATSIVAPPARVLLVEGRAGAADTLREALSRAGVEVRVVSASQLPTRLSDLAPFEGMVLADVSATNLTLEQMTTVREFVRSDGRGLVAVGGRSSFSLGAYKGTPLEQVLPVSATPPPRPERPDVALLLIVDHSASMGAASGVSKMDMAKEAAALAVESLRPEDRVGVLEFDTTQSWVVPFQQVGSGLGLNQIQERIGAIGLGGGTNIYDALNVGLAGLARQESSVRHAVLLTDGRSFTNDLNAYNNLMNLARQQNITLSSIAIGEDSDTELLNDLAQWGGGRYYFASTVEDIPRLTLLESQIARSEPVVEGLFRPELALPHPTVRDFSTGQMPRLDGYVATTLKPEAELVLQSPEGDPLLSAWQYGLGRAVAWTSSADGPWASQWPGWEEYGRFWAQLVRYTLPEPDSGPLEVRVTQQGGQATVRVDARGAGGVPIDLATTVATFTLPDGTQRALPLRQVAPGRYEQVLALPSDGPYALNVRQDKDGATRDALAGFVQAPPAEYAPQPDGLPLLEAIAQASGGQVLSDLPVTTAPAPQPAAAQRIWPWLLLAALLLWVAEIALRRGWLRRA